MKQLVIIFFVFFVLKGHAQLLLPEFETPKKMVELSSESEESMPLPFNDGKSFYFMRTYIDGEGSKAKFKGEDIWFAEMKNEAWKAPYRLFKADYLEGLSYIVGTSKNGERVYLLNTVIDKKGERKKLVMLDKKGRDKWTDPVEIKISNFTFEQKLYHFYMNPEETILMISMSKSETMLDEDLFVSLKQDNGNWGEPIDLGERINTNKFEISPFIAEDGKTLYFSSNGHGGSGGADIFVSFRISDDWKTWTPPLNLGSPINTANSEEYFTIGNNLEVFFTSDQEDSHHNIYRSKATGKFRFANQDATFSYEGLPPEGISLKIYDIDGNLIDEVVTDGYGNFAFKKLNGDGFYLIKVDDEIDEDFVGSKIYFVNENGEKTSRYIYTEEGIFANAKDIKSTEKIRGVFNYKELPMENNALVILDENGFPVDTIYTDKEGNFAYNKLIYDNKYSILPIGLTDEDLKDIELFLVDDKGTVLQHGKLNGKGFLFKPIEVDNSTLAELSDNPVDLKAESKDVIGKAELKDKWNGKGMIKETVRFNFAENEINDLGKERLNSLLIEVKGSKLVLVGHTDMIGLKEKNELRGLERAKAVKQYLVKNGIPEDSITIVSEGEMKPVASNKYEKGRAKNRRVEIMIQQ